MLHLFILQSSIKIGSPSKELFFILTFSHSIIKLCILFFVSFDFLMQVPPSLEGVQFVEQGLLEDILKEVLSLFTTLHDINFLQFFCILQVDFVPKL